MILFLPVKTKISTQKLSVMSNYRYTWNRNWVAPYESLWSILNKFAYFNNVSLQDVKNLFKDAFLKKFLIHRWNLHSISMDTDENNMSIILDLKPVELQKSVLTSMIPESDIEWLTPYKNLRYCPKCIVSGYHNIFHQMYLITKCPIHEVALMEECPNCRRNIPYDITDIKTIRPYACRNCGYEFRVPFRRGMKTDPYRLNGLMIDEFQQGKMDYIFDWFNMFMNTSFSIPRTTHTALNKYFVQQTKNDILNCCTTLIGRNLPDNKTNVNWGRGLKHNIIKYSGNKSGCDTNQSVRYSLPYIIGDNELMLIYKSIRRHFSKLMKIMHMRCVKSTDDKICLGELDKIECFYSFGLLSWLKYWEKKTPKSKKYLMYWKNPLNYDDFLTDPFTEMWLRSRVFANYCFWTFLESILISKWMEHRRNFSQQLCILKIEGRLNPYWSIQVDNSGALIFHQWVKLKHLKTLKMIEAGIKKNKHFPEEYFVVGSRNFF